MSKITINLVTSKPKPQVKAKQLITKKKSDLRTIESFKNFNDNSNFSSSSQKFQSPYNYQAEGQGPLMPNQSQVILDKANDFNNGIPIKEGNLQQVNLHLMSHFKKAEQPPDIYANYLYYKEKIEKALCRSADNMSKYQRSQRKSDNKENRSEERKVIQSTMPANPLEKIRLNRFCNSKNKSQATSVGSMRYQNSSVEGKEFSIQQSANHTAFSFEKSHSKFHDKSVSEADNSKLVLDFNKCSCNLGSKSQLQVQLQQKTEDLEKLQADYDLLMEKYLELKKTAQKDSDSLLKLNDEYQVTKRKLQQISISPISTGGAETQSTKNFVENLQQENQTLLRQKQELETILKEVLFQKERDRFRRITLSVNQSVMNDSEKSVASDNRHSKSTSNPGE